MSEKERKIPRVWEEYDLDLAITARRVLVLEAHSFRQCQKLVYKPIHGLLAETSRNPPEFLICLHGPLYKPKKQKGFLVSIDLVLPAAKVLYLGMVLDEAQALYYWNWCLETYKYYPKIVKDLKQRGPFTILKHKIGCTIPVERSQLNDEAIEEGIRKYLNAFAPVALSSLPIRWLPEEEQLLLETYMWYRAKQQAKPQTKQERQRIFEKDIEKGEYGRADWFWPE